MGQCNMTRENGERPFDYVQCDYENYKIFWKKTPNNNSKFKSSTATAVYMYSVHDFFLKI